MDSSVSTVSAITSPLEFARDQVRASAKLRRLRADGRALQIDPSWLYKFAAGKIPKPGAPRIERLAAYYRANPAIAP